MPSKDNYVRGPALQADPLADARRRQDESEAAALEMLARAFAIQAAATVSAASSYYDREPNAVCAMADKFTRYILTGEYPE